MSKWNDIRVDPLENWEIRSVRTGRACAHVVCVFPPPLLPSAPLPALCTPLSVWVIYGGTRPPFLPYRAATLAFVDSVKCPWILPDPADAGRFSCRMYISVRASSVTQKSLGASTRYDNDYWPRNRFFLGIATDTIGVGIEKFQPNRPRSPSEKRDNELS